MPIKIHNDFEQGSGEWLAARCGLLTASEMKHIITPSKLEFAKNDKMRAHAYELAAQRVSGYVEPHYISDDMLRGHGDEILAREAYSAEFAPVVEAGFITNDQWGCKLGFSPDGLVGDDGIIEVKSRRQKFHIETLASGEMPADYMMQVQTGLLVSGRVWCDFISYCGGWPMLPIRFYADPAVQEAIVRAATAFEDQVQDLIKRYHARIASGQKYINTQRIIEQEII